MNNQFPPGVSRNVADYGCLLLHGYAGSPFEMSYLEQSLRRQGVSVKVPVLAGHEGNPERFAASRFCDWMESAKNALESLQEKCANVVVVGFSMGGTLALGLAEKYSVAGVVTISAPVFLCRLLPYFSPDPRLFLTGLLRHCVRSVPTSIVRPESRRIAPWRGYEGVQYVSVLHSFRLGAEEVRRTLGNITAPIMVVHGRSDRSVHPDNAWEIISRVSSQESTMHLLDVRERVTSGHLLVTHEETRDRVGTLVSDFLQSLKGVQL